MTGDLTTNYANSSIFSSGLNLIKKIASDGTVTYYRSELNDAVSRYAKVKEVLEAANHGDTFYLPGWQCDMEGNDITITSKNNITIYGGGIKLLVTDDNPRPNAYFTVSGCDYFTLKNFDMDCGADITTSGSNGKGLYVIGSTNTLIEKCNFSNGAYLSTNHGIEIYQGDAILRDCVVSNFGYANYQTNSPTSVEIINCDSYFTRRHPSDTGLPITSITRSGSTATATRTNHGWLNGDYVFIEGANQTEYNGNFKIIAVTANTFDYTVTGTPATPATGTITMCNDGWYRFVNLSHNLSATEVTERIAVRGGKWIASGTFETTFDHTPNPALPSKYIEISPSYVKHDDRIRSRNRTMGKFQESKQIVMQNVTSMLPNLDRAVRGYPLADDTSMTIKNCYFASGGFSASITSQSKGCQIDLIGCTFADCSTAEGATLLYAGYKIFLTADKNTKFYNCKYDYFLDQNFGAGTVTRLDCYVEFNTTTNTYLIRFPGDFASMQLGPNFKAKQTSSGAVYRGLALTGTQGGRLSVTDINGIGHFDELLARWLVGQTTATAGVQVTTGSGTQASHNNSYSASGNPFPNTPGKKGDRIINENWLSNGYAREWQHDGTLWVEKGSRRRLSNSLPTAEYFPQAGEIISNGATTDTGQPIFWVVKTAGGLAPAWANSTAYALGQFCKGDSGTKIYICTTAGTSSGSEPTGTGTGLGTGAIWSYLCPVAVLQSSTDVY